MNLFDSRRLLAAQLRDVLGQLVGLFFQFGAFLVQHPGPLGREFVQHARLLFGDLAQLGSQSIDGTDHAQRSLIEHVRVDHSRLHLRVPQQRLHRPDVLARFQ